MHIPTTHPIPTQHRSLHIYIGQTNTNTQTIDEITKEKPIRKLLTGRHIRWQILELHNSTYKKPHKVEEPKIKDWKKKLAVNYKEATIYTYPHMKKFYSETYITTN